MTDQEITDACQGYTPVNDCVLVLLDDDDEERVEFGVVVAVDPLRPSPVARGDRIFFRCYSAERIDGRLVAVRNEDIMAKIARSEWDERHR